jgi:hypothetical protein
MIIVTVCGWIASLSPLLSLWGLYCIELLCDRASKRRVAMEVKAWRESLCFSHPDVDMLEAMHEVDALTPSVAALTPETLR